MEEVEGFLSGQWDYAELKGQTGPLVYPAGFVYLYSALYYITNFGTNILLAQYIFLGLYLAFIAVVMLIYHEAKVVSRVGGESISRLLLILPPLIRCSFARRVVSSFRSVLLGCSSSSARVVAFIRSSSCGASMIASHSSFSTSRST
jgi:hypothetical protein